MNTKTTVAWIVSLAILIFGIWIVVAGGGSESTEAAELRPGAKAASTLSARAAEKPNASPYIEGEGPLTEIIALQRDLKCSITTIDSSPERTGMLYVAGKKIRGDFITVGAGKKLYTAMINDGAHIFTWTIAAKTGLVLLATQNTQRAIVSHGGVTADAILSYECAPWTPQIKFFTPPPVVVFLNSSGSIHY